MADTRVIFMGTPQFAVPSLERIIAKGFSVPAVVTAPDKGAGRGRVLRESPVKKIAVEKGLYLMQPDNLKDPAFISKIKELEPDIIAVVAFRVLPGEVWSLPPLGTVNLHASLLPRYRGAAPINHAIINGEEVTGVTTFLIEKQIDHGQILMQREVPIGPSETAGELHDRLMLVGAGLLEETIERLREGSLTPVPQDEAGGDDLPLAPKISKSDCRIDWTMGRRSVFDFIRGLSPSPASWTILHGKGGEKTTVKIFFAEIPDRDVSLKPGEVLSDNCNYICVGCGDGPIEIKSLQLPGKKRLAVKEFLKGFDFDEDSFMDD